MLFEDLYHALRLSHPALSGVPLRCIWLLRGTALLVLSQLLLILLLRLRPILQAGHLGESFVPYVLLLLLKSRR